MSVLGVMSHLWGIDEAAVFVVPALLFLAAMRWATDRARSKNDARGSEEPADRAGGDPASSMGPESGRGEAMDPTGDH